MKKIWNVFIFYVIPILGLFLNLSGVIITGILIFENPTSLVFLLLGVIGGLYMVETVILEGSRLPYFLLLTIAYYFMLDSCYNIFVILISSFIIGFGSILIYKK